MPAPVGLPTPVGLLAPVGTSATVVKKIQGDVKTVVDSPDIHERLIAIGFDPVTSGDGTWFWSVGEGWGVVTRTGNRVRLELRYGSLDLTDLSFAGTTARIGRTLKAGDHADLTIGG